MLTVLTIVAPVFAIVAVGFLAVRYKLYPAAGVSGLLAFVNNFATPCLLFRAMLSVDFSTAFNPGIITAYYAGAIVVFTAGIVLSRTIFANSPGTAVAAGFAGMFTNTVLLGLPILQRAYGEDALVVIYTIIGLHAPLLITMGIVTMELARRDGGSLGGALKQAGKRAVTNPLLIGILLGLAGNVSGFVQPEPLDALTLMMSQAVLPAALFGLGGALNQYRIRDNWRQAAILSVFKLVVHPAIAWCLMVPIFHVDHDIARYGVVLAAMPAGINVYVFATSFKRAEDVAANTILISTAASVFSVSLWLYLMTII